MKFQYILISSLLFLSACQQNTEQVNDKTYQTVLTANTSTEPFNDYWYAGKAEVNSYDLEQARYGEMRKGDAVLVFVTEPFSKSKQVKLDYAKGEQDEVSVMKLNALRKFNTGIYDYSIMNSTFTPVQLDQYPHSLKATSSSQEWCGQTFTQFNLDGKNYKISGYSYFESEGDQNFKIANALLEDELFSRIRLQANNLPLGELDLIPSTIYTRLEHKPIRPTKAHASLIENGDKKQYVLEYSQINRSLTIEFESAFPYKILSWTENSNGQRSTATLKKSIQSDYWAKNSNRYEGMREELGLRK